MTLRKQGISCMEYETDGNGDEDVRTLPGGSRDETSRMRGHGPNRGIAGSRFCGHRRPLDSEFEIIQNGS
jgi:hypothetical protein